MQDLVDPPFRIPAQSIRTINSSLEPLIHKCHIWAVVAVDLASLSDKAERINITLPARVLRRIDAAAKSAGESRSGYIARRALAA